MRACHVEPTSGHMDIKRTVSYLRVLLLERTQQRCGDMVRNSISSAQFNDVVSSLLIIIIIIINTFFAKFEVQVLFEGRVSL